MKGGPLDQKLEKQKVIWGIIGEKMKSQLLLFTVVVGWALSQTAWAGDNPLFPLIPGAYSTFGYQNGELSDYSLVIGEENFYGQDVWVVKTEYINAINGPEYEFFSIADDGDVLHHGRRFIHPVVGGLIEDVMEPPVRIIDAPMFSGKSWTDVYTWTRYVEGSLYLTQDHQQQGGLIEAVGDLVLVPAGEYSTVEVVNTTPSGFEIRYWFSEGVGIIKKSYDGANEVSLLAPMVQSESKSWGSLKALFR